MTDAMLAGLAKELRDNGIDCETAHKLIHGNEDSRIRISDDEIVDFLQKFNEPITLITLDKKLARECNEKNIPVVYVKVIDLILNSIKNMRQI
jgi:rRNA-processing protein FCF1